MAGHYSLTVRVGKDFEEVYIDKIPNMCPYCHKTINPRVIFGLKVDPDEDSNEELNLLMACSDNHHCSKGFIGIYEFSNNVYYLSSVTFGKPVIKGFNTIIKNISPSFITIYNEAFFAEQHKLMEICGVGYRKAIEFLIKDFSVLNNPNEAESILKMPLMQCINKFIESGNIKKVAERAVWLGNDETHYVRQWSSHDLSDLKKLIDLTVHWIEAEQLTREMVDSMPRK